MTGRSSGKVFFAFWVDYAIEMANGWKQLDWLLLLPVAGLVGFGALTIHSIELAENLNRSSQHLLTGAFGLMLVLAIARYNYRFLLHWHWLIYALTNISLIAVMAIGVTAKGSQRWITIGGFNVQPSEFAKIGMVITLAALLHNKDARNFGTILRTMAITAVPWGLVFLQPDLGTSLVFGVIVMALLYWCNTNPVWLLL